MYLVILRYENGGYRLGNGEGQGFYRCQKLTTVLKTLKKIMKTHKRYLVDCSQFEIYSCTENTKYNDNLPLVKVVKIKEVLNK